MTDLKQLAARWYWLRGTFVRTIVIMNPCGVYEVTPIYVGGAYEVDRIRRVTPEKVLP